MLTPELTGPLRRLENLMADATPQTVVPESHRDILDKKGFAHIATLGPKGEPESNPVWYGWDGESLSFSNTKDRQKYKNLVRTPRAAASIIDPDNPYRYLELRGDVTIEDDPDYAFINEMAHKYLDKDYPWLQPGEQRVIIRIRPTHATHQG